MRIRDKTLLIIGVTLFVVLAVLFVFAQMILGGSVSTAESRTIRQDIERTLGILQYQISDLNRVVSDWAPWDDAYAFIKDGNQAFIDSNITDTTFLNLRINVILFVKPTGEIVLGKAYDLANSKFIPVPDDLKAGLTPTSPLVNHGSTASHTEGLIMLNSGPMLIASEPILTSLGEGPIRGAVIFGRYLDDDGIQALSRLVQLPVRAFNYHDSLLPSAALALPSLQEQVPIISRKANEDTITSYTLVRDIYGQPGLVLSIDEVRTDYQQSRTTLAYFLVALLLVGVALILLDRTILDRLVLARLFNLRDQMQRLGANGELTARVSMDGADELTELTSSINGMLSAFAGTHQRQLESEQRYRAVVEQAFEGILLVDAGTKRILESNAAYQKLTGYMAAELQERTLYEMMAQDRASVDRAIEAALHGGQVAFGEHLHQRRNGLPVSVEASLTQVSYGGSQVLCMVVRDITERKWVREALRRNEEYYRSLIDNSLDPIGILNADGIIYYISPAVERVFGANIQNLIGTSAFDYIHKDDVWRVRALFEKGLETPGQTTQVELRLQHADGSWRVVEAAGKNLMNNPSVVGIVFNFRDITERRAMEEALRENELRYRMLVEASTDAIFLETLDNRIIDCNASACQMFGYTKEEFLHLTVMDLVPAEAQQLLPGLAASAQEYGGFFIESVNRRKDGHVFPCEVNARLVTLDGKEMVIAYCRDISERKRNEKMQEAVYRIAQTADECETLDDLYAAIHGIVQGVMPAENFYIALYDADHDLIYFPYFRDAVDQPPSAKKPGRGLTEYVLRTGKSFLCPLAQNEELQRRGEVDIVGAPSLIWVGVPLIIGGRAIGVMAVQNYENEQAYGLREQQMLEYVSSQVAKVIDRKSEMVARAEAEQALRESEERYRQLVEFSPDGIAIHSQGRFVFVNPAAAKMIGAKQHDDIIGKPILDVVHPNYRDSVMKRVRQTHEQGEENPLVEEKFLRLDGQVIDVEVAAIPFTYHGKPGAQVVVRDITERKRTDAALRDQLIALQTLAEIDREMLALKEPEAVLELVCRRAAELVHGKKALVGLTRPDQEPMLAGYGLNDAAGTLAACLRYTGPDLSRAIAVPQLDTQNEAIREWQTREGVCSMAVVPLRAGNDLLGLLVVFDTEPKNWPQVQMLDLLAHQTVLTLEKVRLLSETQQRADEFQALYASTRDLAEARELDAVLKTVASRVVKLLSVSSAAIALFDRERGELEFIAGENPLVPLGTRIGLDRGMVGLVARTRQPLIVNNYDQFEPHLALLNGEPIRAQVAVPMLYGGDLTGVVVASRIASNRHFTESDMRLLSLLATNTASAIHNARLFQETRTRAQQLQLVYEAGLTVNRVLEPRAQLQLLFKTAMQALRADRAEFLRYDPVHCELQGELAFGLLDSALASFEQLHLSMDDPANRLAEPARTNKPLNLPDLSADQRWQMLDPAVRSGLWAPVTHENQLIGVLGVLNLEQNAFSADDEQLLALFANQAAVGLENARLFAETQRRADHLAVLNRISNAASQTLDLDELLEVIHSETSQLLHPEAFFIALYDQVNEELEYRIRIDMGVRVQSDRKRLSETQLTARVVTSRQPLLVKDMEADRAKYPVPSLWGSMRATRSWVGVPMQIGTNVLGVISLQAYFPNAFSEEDARLLMTIADQAALVIEKTRLFNLVKSELEERTRAEQAEREQRTLAEALRDTTEALNTSLRSDEILERIMTNVGRVVPHDAVNIMLIKGARVSIVKCQGYARQGVTEETILALDKSLDDLPSLRRCQRDKQPLIVPMTATEPNWVQMAETEWIQSFVAAPIEVGGEVIGFVNLDSATPGFFQPVHAERLKTFADQAAVALEKARWFEQTQRRLAELEAVNRISSALRVAQQRQEMLPILLDQTLAILGTDAGQIGFYDPATHCLQMNVARGWFAQLPPYTDGVGLSRLVMETHQAQITHEFRSDPRSNPAIRDHTPPDWGGAVIPIRAANEIIGIMRIAVQLPREIQPDEIHLLTTIAEIAGNAVHRATLNEQTERRIQRLAALQTIDMAISASLDLRITLDILLDQVIAQLEVDAVDVLLLHPHTQQLQWAAGRGFRAAGIPRAQMRLGEGLAGRAALERQIVHVPDLTHDPTSQAKMSFLRSEEFIAYYGVPLIAKGQVKGVLEIFNRAALQADPEWLNFLQALAGEAAIALADAQLFEDLQRSNLELALAYDATIEGWARALEMRDQEQRGHTQRVVMQTLELARRMGIGETMLPHIRRGALLHDIGKMAVPDSILLKTGPLTEEEWKVMQQHPAQAFAMLSPIAYMRQALDIPYCHHERWDGTGYPRGLKGEQIPLAARIFAIVDVWDALSSDRAFRPAWPADRVHEYILKESGKAFDPHVVEAFVKMLEDEAREDPKRF